MRRMITYADEKSTVKFWFGLASLLPMLVVANADDASPGSGSFETGDCGSRGGGGRHNSSRGRSQRSHVMISALHVFIIISLFCLFFSHRYFVYDEVIELQLKTENTDV